MHTDQFGNPVWVQGMVEQPIVCTQVQGQQPTVTERQLDVNPMNQSRKKSGRYNIADTPHCTSHLCWPDESYLAGSQHKRTAYDDMTLGQFVTGFMANVLDTQHMDTTRNVLKELGETVKLAENLSWPIARGAFAISMHKIEEETLTWADCRALADNRLTYSQSAF